MLAPNYLHDCDSCIFLGNYIWKNREYDLYVCKQGRLWPTVIARFSSDGPDYISGLETALLIEAKPEKEFDDCYPLVEAMNRAKGSGHLTRKETSLNEQAVQNSSV